MPFDVDASVTASWLLPDESDARAEQAYALLDPKAHGIQLCNPRGGANLKPGQGTLAASEAAPFVRD
jgi:hypothetical protein